MNLDLHDSLVALLALSLLVGIMYLLARGMTVDADLKTWFAAALFYFLGTTKAQATGLRLGKKP